MNRDMTINRPERAIAPPPNTERARLDDGFGRLPAPPPKRKREDFEDHKKRQEALKAAANGARTLKKRRYDAGSVTMIVGSANPCDLLVPLDFLDQASRVFRSMLKGPWIEAKTNTIRLPYDDPDVVNAYIEWLASGSIASRDATNRSDLEPNEWKFLAELYVFGEKYQDDPFCNAVISAMAALADVQFVASMTTKDTSAALNPADSIEEHHRQEAVDLIYAGTPQGSPARKLMVAVLAREIKMPSWLDASQDGWHADLAKDLLEALFEEKEVISVVAKSLNDMFARRQQWFKS